ncbi:hypothetical protein WOLCODRAFT_161707 [Wolfiporia cocos MD-104 SS10]|uniref:Zn(2)-C6 fungal-type domain-containing protein n=1 Tax=Wolfiporia cocos (strain MD-104) TaxID=742152 RepID=A0A2H3J9M0_WOLCO|nr:hypothetical protein WOLCODRAFT_161707 [Wolfiporia cocos MD-104 SS10]
MSSRSDDDEHTGSENVNHHERKRRRLKRTQACDVCRRKKIKCDGDQKPDRRCTHCTTSNRECTYSGSTDRSLTRGYVTSLESRLEKMEQLLGQMRPEASTSVAGPSHPPPPPESDTLLYGTTTLERVSRAMYRNSDIVQKSASHVDAFNRENLDFSDDEVTDEYSLIQSLRQLRVNPDSLRFFGKSSSAMLVRTAYRTKTESGDEIHGGHQRPRFWGAHPWLMPELQREPPPHRPDCFPDDELMRTLIDSYFANVNPYHPLLHRPTFERNIENLLHLRDEGFGSTVLLVCAVGARFLDDPRVLLPGYENDPLSRGWEWYKEVHVVHKSPYSLPRLYDLQICCLTAQFMEATYSPQASWALIGVGIRLAQDVGAHRKKVYNREHRVEEELWKRAFWTLIMMDRYLSTALGRPCAMQDEDLDLDLLFECDDEYWINPDPGLSFKQPAGKPSYIAYFNNLLRLNQILACAQRTIYSSKKFRSMLGVTGPEWEERLVTELDSALNRWIDSVPDHLRWDPNREDKLFFNQSAHIYVAFYQTQIFVHRPFLQAPRKPTAQFFPSLAICTNAARSCIHILDLQFKRTKFHTFNDQISLFTSGIVLLLNIWSAKSSGVTIDTEKEMADVHTCMSNLKAGENRWHLSGRVWDVMYELTYASDLPLPQSPKPNRKRARDVGDGEHRTWMTASLPMTGHSPMSDFVESNANSPAASSSTEPPVQHQQHQASQVAWPAEIPSVSSTSSSVGSPSAQATGADATTAFSPDIQTNGVNPTAGFLPTDNAFSTLSQPAFGTLSNGFPAFSPGVSSEPSMMTPDAAPSEEGVDPVLSSMFSAPDRDVWGTLFQAIPTQGAAMQNDPLSVDSSLQGAADLTGGAPEAGQSGTNNLMAMWSSMPTNFDWRDWDAYISHMNDFMGGEAGPGPG